MIQVVQNFVIKFAREQMRPVKGREKQHKKIVREGERGRAKNEREREAKNM